jgi:hypothetical protein
VTAGAVHRHGSTVRRTDGCPAERRLPAAQPNTYGPCDKHDDEKHDDDGLDNVVHARDALQDKEV